VGIYLNSDEIDALYESIHRLTQPHVVCSPELVKKIARRFHSTNYTRLDAALKIYWELSEGRHTESMAGGFINALREEKASQTEKAEAKKFVKQSLKNFWTKEGASK